MAKETQNEISLAIVAAADRAIKFQNQNPQATIDEAIGHAMNSGGEPSEAGVVAIAAATEVFRFKERHRRAKDREVLQFVISKIPEILDNIRVEA